MNPEGGVCVCSSACHLGQEVGQDKGFGLSEQEACLKAGQLPLTDLPWKVWWTEMSSNTSSSKQCTNGLVTGVARVIGLYAEF